MRKDPNSNYLVRLSFVFVHGSEKEALYHHCFSSKSSLLNDFTQTLTTLNLEHYGIDAEEAGLFANALVQNKVILISHYFDFSSPGNPLLLTGIENTPTWRKRHR